MRLRSRYTHASTLRVVDESDSEIGEADVGGNKDGEVAVCVYVRSDVQGQSAKSLVCGMAEYIE